MSKPPVIGRRLAYCNCGRLVHWEDLRMARDVFLQPQSENRFSHSSYHQSFWACDGATNVGRISEGPFLHQYTITYDSSNNAIESGGSQTWQGEGVFRSTVPVNCSSATSICFSFEVGPYHRSTRPTLTIETGMTNSDGSLRVPEKTIDKSLGQRHLYWNKRVADIDPRLSAASAYFYVRVIPESAQRWFVDRLLLEFNKKEPGVFVATYGAPIIYSSQTTIWRVVRTCPECRKHLRKTVDTTAVVEQPVMPIPADIETEIV